jgi:hypothetical protein
MEQFEVGKYYCLANGQEVILEAIVVLGDKTKFFVIPFYGGYAMGCKLYPSGHTEIEVPYEVEGHPILVDNIFHDPLDPKIAEDRKKHDMELFRLKKEILNSQTNLQKAQEEEKEVKKEIADLLKDKEILLEETARIREERTQLEERAASLQKDLAEIEDGISKLSGTERDERLAYLVKRDFELKCLENGGVDNWEWYGESLEDYRRRYGE